METFDTNVLVRVLVEDDPEQSATALEHWRRALEAGGVFLPKVVLVETVWVLGRAYGFERERIRAVLAALLRLRGLTVEDRGEVEAALGAFTQTSADFSDHLILEVARAVDALPVQTFDTRFARVDDVRLLGESAP
jgi:predicted nucleic-acid-binding protein